MKTLIGLVAVLVAGTAHACDYNKVAVAVPVQAVPVAVPVATPVATPVAVQVATPVYATPVYATPVLATPVYATPVVAVPTVHSFAVVTPVVAVNKNVRVVRANNNAGSGVVGIARAAGRTVRNVLGAVVGR